MYANTKYRPLLDRILFLLKHKQLGPPKQCAQKLGCSVRSFNYRLARLRQEGHRFSYDRILQRYVMEEGSGDRD